MFCDFFILKEFTKNAKANPKVGSHHDYFGGS